jgi:hypothetical protein
MAAERHGGGNDRCARSPGGAAATLVPDDELDRLLNEGVPWLLQARGLGRPEDLDVRYPMKRAAPTATNLRVRALAFEGHGPK